MSYGDRMNKKKQITTLRGIAAITTATYGTSQKPHTVLRFDTLFFPNNNPMT